MPTNYPKMDLSKRSAMTDEEWKELVVPMHSSPARKEDRLPEAELNDVIRSAVRQLGKHIGRRFDVLPDCTRCDRGIMTIRITETPDEITTVRYSPEDWTEEQRVRALRDAEDPKYWALPHTPEPRSGWWVVNVTKLPEP